MRKAKININILLIAIIFLVACEKNIPPCWHEKNDLTILPGTIVVWDKERQNQLSQDILQHFFPFFRPENFHFLGIHNGRVALCGQGIGPTISHVIVEDFTFSFSNSPSFVKIWEKCDDCGLGRFYSLESAYNLDIMIYEDIANIHRIYQEERAPSWAR